MATGTEYKHAFSVFKDHIVHVHIKDGDYNADGKWERCMLGDGMIDVQWVCDQGACSSKPTLSSTSQSTTKSQTF